MEHTELNLEFLKRLQPNGGVTEISDLTHNLGGIEDYEKIIEWFSSTSDLYFISFLPNDKREQAKEKEGRSPRTKNEFVKGINYLKADFDIRRNIKEREGRIISDQELLEYKDLILERLKMDIYLGTYTAVLHSGNGIHIYRIGDTVEVDPRTYSRASKELYTRIKDVLTDHPELWPDFACSNIGRLLRLPGSKNHKKDYWLPAHEVEILEYNEEPSQILSNLIEFTTNVGTNFVDEDDVPKIMLNVGKLENLWLVINWIDLFHRINEEVSIADLVCEYTGRKMDRDGKNFISNKDGCHTGAFIVPEANIVVHTGTPHISDRYPAYSPFAFLLVHYANGDPKRAFEIAREKFPRLRDEEPKFLFDEWLVRNGRED